MLSTKEFEKPVIIISGIKMIEGGILTILKDCLYYLDNNLAKDYSIVALVHDKSFFDTKHIHFIEFKPKANWFKRIYLEYYYFNKISEYIKPLLWLSLHDITPRVHASVQAVYCHNAMTFYKPSLSTLILDPKQVAFSWFYKYLYRINIKRNDYVVVQQQWIKKAFEQMFPINNVVVSYPDSKSEHVIVTPEQHTLTPSENKKITLFYPSFPRVFKNFEVLCKAAEILSDQGHDDLNFVITVSGQENKYARRLYERFRHVQSIRWVGLIPLEEVHRYYSKADALIFPSKLETWGLPISEFKEYNKPIFAADLPYAYETTSDFDKVSFFNPDDAIQLSRQLIGFKNGEIRFDQKSKAQRSTEISYGWSQLFDKLLTLKK